jgi:hypothetical protein
VSGRVLNRPLREDHNYQEEGHPAALCTFHPTKIITEKNCQMSAKGHGHIKSGRNSSASEGLAVGPRPLSLTDQILRRSIS